MTTPVLFLDHASRSYTESPQLDAERIVLALLSTLRALRKLNRRFAINATEPLARIKECENWTLIEVLRGAKYRDEWDFIRALGERSPLSSGLTSSFGVEVERLD